MLALFTIIHPLVDACSVSVLVAGGATWERVIAYNAMAFALQLSMGMFLDEWPRCGCGGFFVGTGMVLAAAIVTALGFGGWGVLAAACVGNALFHLTTGKYILETREGRAGPIGLFISTGALGLMAGQVWAAKAAMLCLTVFTVALAACVVLAAVREWGDGGRLNAPAQDDGVALWPRLILLGLFVLIAWRSWAGLFVTGRSAGGCALMMLAGAVVTFMGKVAGGYLAERVGRWKVTIFSVMGSVALAFFCEPSWIVAWLVLLFVAQLATGPVLSLVYDKTNRRGGFAFGLNCLGLFVGSLA